MGLSRIETETVISFNAEEDFVVVSTRMQRIKTKLRKLGIAPYRRQTDYECYRMPVTFIKIGKPRKVSDSQKRVSRKNLPKVHPKVV